MGVVLALAAALGYGLSDFVGGVASRRSSPWPVALLAGAAGLAGAVGLALALRGDPAPEHLAWGAVSGVGSGVGTAFLYRGFAAGRMGVVAPLSAVGSALVPVAVGLGLGERPAALVWTGLAMAFPGIWLVARVPGDPSGHGRRLEEAPAGTATGLTDGALAGLGFGVLFVALGQVPDGAGYWPLVAGQAASLLVIVAVATALGVAWIPTVASEWWGAVAGLLGTGAVLAFLLATQTGLLTVAAVLTSLYPAFTILLAALLLREHVFRAQALGLLLCGASVALVASG